MTSDVNTQLAAMVNSKTAKTTKCDVTGQKPEQVSYPLGLSSK